MDMYQAAKVVQETSSSKKAAGMSGGIADSGDTANLSNIFNEFLQTVHARLDMNVSNMLDRRTNASSRSAPHRDKKSADDGRGVRANGQRGIDDDRRDHPKTERSGGDARGDDQKDVRHADRGEDNRRETASDDGGRADNRDDGAARKTDNNKFEEIDEVDADVGQIVEDTMNEQNEHVVVERTEAQIEGREEGVPNAVVTAKTETSRPESPVDHPSGEIAAARGAGKTKETMNRESQGPVRSENAEAAKTTAIDLRETLHQSQDAGRRSQKSIDVAKQAVGSAPTPQAKAALDPNAAKDAAKARQAADLSARIGDDAGVSIKVSVTGEAKAPVSKSTRAPGDAARSGFDAQKPSPQTQQTLRGAAVAGLNPVAQQARGGNGQAATQIDAGTQVAVRTAGGSGGVNKSPTWMSANHGGQSNAGGEVGQTGGPNANTQTTQANQSHDAKRAARARADRRAHAKHEVTSQVEVRIAKAIKLGADKINIRLRPADMGRVEVQMEMSRDGRIAAVVTADNQRSLDMLKDDVKSLERAFQDAGFQTDRDSLQFGLKGQGRQADGDGGKSHGGEEPPLGDGGGPEASAEANRDIVRRDRIDLTA